LSGQGVVMLMAAVMVGTAVLAASGARSVPEAGQPACQLGGVTVPGWATRSMAPEQFRTLHAAVAPRGESERWMEIPWQSDLLAARQQAAREGKPLLMWVMDGHPLGCT
jgi:hypothetical protein